MSRSFAVSETGVLSTVPLYRLQMPAWNRSNFIKSESVNGVQMPDWKRSKSIKSESARNNSMKKIPCMDAKATLR
jgi:hypothetical protein